MAIHPGQGTVLQVGTGAISQVVEIDGPRIVVPTKPTPELASQWGTHRALIPEGGALRALIQYDPNDETHYYLTWAISQYPQQPQVCGVTFNCSPPSAVSFQALVTEFNPQGMNQEDNLEAWIELKVTGPVTWSIA